MPQMANIVVKAADDLTDVTYTANVPSAGDSSPAQWTQNAASTIRASRPTIRAISTYNGPRTARRFSLIGKYPVVRTIDGVETVVATIPLDVVVTLPLSVTDTEASEAVRQFGNLFVSDLIRQSAESGYAPT